jgi:hypothetical protein
MPVEADPFGEGSLKRALAQFLEHYHAERPLWVIKT